MTRQNPPIGHVFPGTQWTVIGKTFQKCQPPKNGSLHHAHYVKLTPCRCVCGNVRDVRIANALDGKSRSCGCLRGPKLQNRIVDGVDEIALGLAVLGTRLAKREIPSHETMAAFAGCSRERIRQIEEEALAKLRVRLVKAGITESDLPYYRETPMEVARTAKIAA